MTGEQPEEINKSAKRAAQCQAQSPPEQREDSLSHQLRRVPRLIKEQRGSCGPTQEPIATPAEQAWGPECSYHPTLQGRKGQKRELEPRRLNPKTLNPKPGALSAQGITDFDFALAKAMDQISPSEAQDVQKHVPEVHMKDFLGFRL